MIKFPFAAAGSAILIATAAGISACGPQSSVTQSYTFTVPVTSLIVNDTVGSVSVSDGSGSEVSVTATINYSGSMPAITHMISGQALTLGHSACSDCGVAFTVTVPRAASAAIHLSTGSVTVSGIAGGVTVGDDTGSVTMTGLTGDVSVQDDTGSVSGTGLSGLRASFHEGTGSIDVAFAAAPVQLNAVSGTGHVSVSVPSGTAYQVNAISHVGKVSVSVPQSATASHVITAIATTGMVSVSNS